MCDKVYTLMKWKFFMQVMGKSNFFIGLQVKQSEEEFFINQAHYTRELNTKFGVQQSKSFRIPTNTNNKMDPNCEGKSVNHTD